MTREEAIKIIKIVLAVAEDFEITVQGEKFTEEKCKEAIDMAIKALQQEPCENIGNIYKCSCGYGWDKDKVVRHHFCPNCGRKVLKAESEVD